jgi:hypothetical protein
MNVCWCIPSGGGCSGGGVSGVVCAASHYVPKGCTRLVSCLVQRAGGAAVANFDLVSVCPAVANFVPHWFGVTLLRGPITGLRHWGGRCCCVRGRYSGGKHSCIRELDVSNGLSERCIGGHQVVDGGVLPDCCICKIVK